MSDRQAAKTVNDVSTWRMPCGDKNSDRILLWLVFSGMGENMQICKYTTLDYTK